MIILHKNRLKLFDGAENLLRKTISFSPTPNNNLVFTPASLTPLEDISSTKGSGISEAISTLLGFKTLKFDGMNLFPGSKKGLNLHYTNSIDEIDIIAIFSFGEYQPGRYICYYEGLVDISQPYLQP